MREYKAGIIPASSQMGRELREWLEKWHFPGTIMLFDKASGNEMLGEGKKGIIHCGSDDSLLEACDILFDCDEEQPLSLPLSHHGYMIHLGKEAENAKALIPSLNLDQFKQSDHELQIPFAAFILFANVYATVTKYQRVKQAVMTSLHSVAEMGDDACLDLSKQLQAYAKGDSIESSWFPFYDIQPHLPLLFQALPQTSHFNDYGNSEEEQRFQRYAKAFGFDLTLSATCVRIASFRGLSMSIAFLCEDVLHLNLLIDTFSSNPAMICFDDIPHNMYPITADALHDYRIYIGRMRRSDAHTFTTWAVCDDLAIRCSAAVKLAFYILHNFL